MQDRGLAAYIAELLGTFFLVFTVGSRCDAVRRHHARRSTGLRLRRGRPRSRIRPVRADPHLRRCQRRALQPGRHDRRREPCGGSTRSTRSCTSSPSSPAASSAPCRSRASCSTRAGSRHYGAATVSPLLGGDFDGMLIEAIGTFLLVLVICAVAFNPRARQEWAPLAIGTTLGIAVMFMGPLTGGSFNPARWFGPALIGDEFGGTWPYLLGPLIGCPAGGRGLPVRHRRPAVRARRRATHDRRTRGGAGGQGRRDPRQGGLGPPSRTSAGGPTARLR